MRRDSAAAVTFFAVAHFCHQRALADDLGPMLPVLFQADTGFAFAAAPGAGAYRRRRGCCRKASASSWSVR